jgi:hypothetical protein
VPKVAPKSPAKVQNSDKFLGHTKSRSKIFMPTSEMFEVYGDMTIGIKVYIWCILSKSVNQLYPI